MSLSKTKYLIGSIGGIFVALLGLTTWIMQAPAIPYSKMAMMRVGMSESEVTELLGSPGSKFFESGGERWVYSRHTWAMYNVYFGDDGRVARFEHDF